MKRILLDIYSSIDDPDGIYAIAQSGDTASQLRLMQHEGARKCFDTLCAFSVSFEESWHGHADCRVSGVQMIFHRARQWSVSTWQRSLKPSRAAGTMRRRLEQGACHK